MTGATLSLREAHAAQTRARLLAAAIEILSVDGLGELSLHEVAKVAGVSPPTAYRHFPTMNALIAGVLDEFERRMRFGAVPTTTAELLEALPKIHAGFEREEQALLAYVRARSATPFRESGRRRRAGYVLDAVIADRPQLSAREARVVAAVLQMFIYSGTWELWRNVWGFQGEPAGRLAAWAVSALLRELEARPDAFRAIAAQIPDEAPTTKAKSPGTASRKTANKKRRRP